MATYNFAALPTRMHASVVRAFNENNFAYLRQVYVKHGVVSCPSCLHGSQVKEWTQWAITNKIITDDQSGTEVKVPD